MVREVDFRSPKVSVDCEQEHDLRNRDFKTGFSKNVGIPCRFRGQNHGNFMKKIFKSLGRGCQTERVLGAKCGIWLPKTSRNLVHVMKKWKCAKKCDSLKTINGANDLLCLLTLISRRCKSPSNSMQKEWGFILLQGVCIKSSLGRPLKTLYNPCHFL